MMDQNTQPITILYLPHLPPQNLQDALIAKVNGFYAVKGARFEGTNLVANSTPTPYSNAWEKMHILIEGMIEGYILAEVKPEPYSITYTIGKIASSWKQHPSFTAFLKHWEVDDLRRAPDICFLWKEVTESFVTRDEMLTREEELRTLMYTSERNPVTTQQDALAYRIYKDITTEVDTEKFHWFTGT